MTGAACDAQVLDTCLAAGVPVCGYVGGGYSPDLDVLARRHCTLHRAASMMWDSYQLGDGASCGVVSPGEATGVSVVSGS